jgi:hypothetical protein
MVRRVRVGGIDSVALLSAALKIDATSGGIRDYVDTSHNILLTEVDGLALIIESNNYTSFVENSSTLVSKFIPELIWNNVVDGSNVEALYTYIQEAFNYCAQTHSTLVFPPYNYLMGGGVTYNYGTHSIVGNSAKLDYSTVSAGIVCFSITTPNNFNTLWDSAVHAIQGIVIKGSTYGNSRVLATGIQFGVGLSSSGAHAAMQNCVVAGFTKGISFGDHSYVQKIDSCAIHNCDVLVDYAGISLEDSGERIGFTNCVLFNSNTLVHATGGNLSFSNCSFDYFTEEALIAEFGGSIYISDSHIESINNPNIKPWMVAKDSNSRICISNTPIVVNEGISVYIGVADDSVDGSDTGSADAGIFLSNSHVSFTPTGEYNLQSLFKGAVYISNLGSFDGGRYSPLNKRVHVYGDRNNLLVDGSFERNLTPKDWKITTGIGYVQPDISSNQAATGTKSLRINPEGSVIKIRKVFQVAPTAKPTFSFKTFGSVPIGSTFTVTVGYDSAFYDGLVSARTFVYSYTTEISSTWKVESVRPYSRAPVGASKFYVEIQATGSSDVYLDDMIVEILDNHVSNVDLSDTSIDNLVDVDTSTIEPSNGQILAWSSSAGKWVPSTSSSSGNLSDTISENIAGVWNFSNGAKLANFTFYGNDINDITTTGNSGLTVNYTSPDAGAYYRDFTVFNGRGLAAMKIFGSSRTALFYSSLQFGAITAGLNQILYTGYLGETGDTSEIAVSYNSSFDTSTSTYSSPWFRSFHIFNGKGASIAKFVGNSTNNRIDFNTDNFYISSRIVFRSNGLINTIDCSLSDNRAQIVPDASGTFALQEWVTPLVESAKNIKAVSYKTASYTALYTDTVLLFDTPADQVLTLPDAVLSQGKFYNLSNVGANSVTINSVSGSIQWAASQILLSQEQRTLISDGNNWFWC